MEERESPSDREQREKDLRRVSDDRARREQETHKARTDELASFWRGRLYIGCTVVEKNSGYTGEVRKFHESGVEVWIPDTGYTRQNWSWHMLTMRFPRKIKRYPRPFRFPREEPTQCCHCKVGRMEVEGQHEVRCTRCKLLIGEESFPRRIKRAESFIRKKFDQSNRRRPVRKRVARPSKRKAPHPRPKRKAPNRVGVLPSRRKEEKRDGQDTTIGNPTVPPPQENPAVPAPQEEVKKEGEVVTPNEGTVN